MSNIWEIVGGVEKGGILVREGESLTSPQASTRLSTGALVEEIWLSGERLHYRLVCGTGPAEGWVSTKLKGKELAVKTDRIAYNDETDDTLTDSSKLTQLHDAIRSGDAQRLTVLLQAHEFLADQRFHDGKTPLSTVAHFLGGASVHTPDVVFSMVSQLLKHQANPNIASPPMDETPLQVIVRQILTLRTNDTSVCLNVIRKLLESEADPNQSDDLGETPLFEAVVSGNSDACKLLLSHGASARQCNLNGKTALDMAADSQLVSLLQAAAKSELDNDATSPTNVGCDIALDPVFDFGNLEDQEAELSQDSPSVISAPQACKSTEELMPNSLETPAAVLSAQSLREEGNKHFKAKRYVEAKHMYKQALQLDPMNATLYSNLAAASLMLAEWTDAFNHSADAVRRDPMNAKACERCARSMLLSNMLQEGYGFCHNQRIPKLSDEQRSSEEWQPFLKTAQRLSHHTNLLHHMEQVLADKRQMLSEGPSIGIAKECDALLGLLSETEKTSPFGVRVYFTKLRACLFPMPGESGQTLEAREYWSKEALGVCDQLLRGNPTWPDSHHWRARCLVRLGRRREAREALKKAQRFAKEKNGEHIITNELLESMRLIDAKKQQGNYAYKEQDWKLALECYDAAVQEDEQEWRKRMDVELSAQLYFNRSSVRSKLGQSIMALEDVHRAISLQPSYTKALFRRGLLYMDLEQYAKASEDFENVARLEPSFSGLSDCRSRAWQWMKQPPKRNHYAILGVSQNADAAEIKKAYRAMALKWHPDKNPGDKQKAEENFKSVLEAFEVLSDPQKRAEYDGLDAHTFGKRFFSGVAHHSRNNNQSFRSRGHAGTSFFYHSGGRFR